MKLLHEVVRLCTVGARGLSVSGTAGPREFRVTVPASRPTAVVVDAAMSRESGVTDVPIPAPRSEPASFLKAPRHLRQVSGR
ncbi:MAG TPA: hypothetical protein VLZ55_08965 [Rhodanobacter sp.]|jgi:hypothetical protein|nr:hypothetical protein [Rhodanobacter sp.]